MQENRKRFGAPGPTTPPFLFFHSNLPSVSTSSSSSIELCGMGGANPFQEITSPLKTNVDEAGVNTD
jgi:hypothetical protein